MIGPFRRFRVDERRQNISQCPADAPQSGLVRKVFPKGDKPHEKTNSHCSCSHVACAARKAGRPAGKFSARSAATLRRCGKDAGRVVGDLLSHREAAPVVSYALQLTDNLQQVVNGITTPDATGTVFPAVADGYYLMLRPLPAGQHVIKFGGVLFGGALDVTYQMSVTSTRSIEPVVLVP